MEIEIFDDDVNELIRAFDKRTKAKFTQVFETLELCGSRISMPFSKKIAKGLFELRISGSIEVRIFYTFYLGKACLLYVFVKKSQRIPLKELNIALKRKNDLYKS